MVIAMTQAKTGRSMKKLAMMRNALFEPGPVLRPFV
jgi:hypothetical protein